MIEAMKQALEALEQVTKELLAVRDELAERGARPTTNVFHQRLWDSSFSAYTDHAIPAAQSLRQAIREHAMYEVQRLGQEIEQEPDKYEMDIECTKCGAKQSGVLTVNTHPPQRTWVGLTGEMLLKAAQSSLSPEQYDHFEAMSKYQPDIYDRLAYAIRVQDE